MGAHRAWVKRETLNPQAVVEAVLAAVEQDREEVENKCLTLIKKLNT